MTAILASEHMFLSIMKIFESVAMSMSHNTIRDDHQKGVFFAY
jgi:hypothetical protein